VILDGSSNTKFSVNFQRTKVHSEVLCFGKKRFSDFPQTMATFDVAYGGFEEEETRGTPAIQMMGDHSAPMGQTSANILCCQCGSTIPPNPTNMCVQCLSGRCDITEGIATQVRQQRDFIVLSKRKM
jgi:hypothetical protein